MGDTGIGNAGNDIGLGKSALEIAQCQMFAALVTGVFDIHPLVSGSRESVVDPQECADPHIVKGFLDCLHAVGGDEADFAGAEFLLVVIAQIQVGEALETDTSAVFLAADLHRRSAQPVAGRVNTVLGHDHQGHGTADQILGITNTVLISVALVDERGRELCRIDIPSAHLQEVRVCAGEELPHELL